VNNGNKKVHAEISIDTSDRTDNSDVLGSNRFLCRTNSATESAAASDKNNQGRSFGCASAASDDEG